MKFWKDKLKEKVLSEGKTKKNVKIITDWTGKERKEQHLTVKDVKTNKTFNIPKKEM